MPRLQQAHPVDASDFTLGTTNLRSRKTTLEREAARIPLSEGPAGRVATTVASRDKAGVAVSRRRR